MPVLAVRSSRSAPHQGGCGAGWRQRTGAHRSPTAGAATGPLPAQLGEVGEVLIVIGVVAGVLFGFVAGLLTFRRSQQWCSFCGATKQCPNWVSHFAAGSTR